MERPMTWLCVAMTAVFLYVGVVARATDEEVELQEVPKPVIAAVKARFADGELTAAAKEMDEGKLVYEVTVKQKGKNIDVILTPEGQIELIEKQIGAEALPEAAAKAVERRYPKATYQIVEEMIEVTGKEEKLACYEVRLVTADEEELEVKVTAGGEIIKEERKEPKQD